MITAASSSSSTPLNFPHFFANSRVCPRCVAYRFYDLFFIALALVATIIGANDCQAIALFAR